MDQLSIIILYQAAATVLIIKTTVLIIKIGVIHNSKECHASTTLEGSASHRSAAYISVGRTRGWSIGKRVVTLLSDDREFAVTECLDPTYEEQFNWSVWSNLSQ